MNLLPGVDPVAYFALHLVARSATPTGRTASIKVPSLTPLIFRQKDRTQATVTLLRFHAEKGVPVRRYCLYVTLQERGTKRRSQLTHDPASNERQSTAIVSAAPPPWLSTAPFEDSHPRPLRCIERLSIISRLPESLTQF